MRCSCARCGSSFLEGRVGNRGNVLALTVTALLSVAALQAQEAPAAVQPPVGGAAARPAPPPSKPTPHWSDGRVNLGALVGESGIWAGDGRLAVNPKSYEPNSTRNALIHIDKIPLQDWARALVDARHGEFLKMEPHARCNSQAVRAVCDPCGFEIVDFPSSSG